MPREAPESPPPGTDTASLIASHDWERTPLGRRESWPASLGTVLRLMLSSRYAMWLGWGPDLAFFYNDAYAEQTLGAKHPWALGRPASEVWAEVWEDVRRRVERVVGTGESTWDEGLFLMLERNGYPEETYHTFSYSPAPGDAPGEIAGLFCVVIEETERVIGARRIAFLRELAAALAPTTSVARVMEAAADVLVAASKDIPFSLVYLFDESGETARLVAQTGFAGPHPFTPETLSARAPSPWPLAAGAADPERIVLPTDVVWPTGAWKLSPKHALVVPILAPGQTRPAGLFVAGLSPHRPLDNGLESFVQLVVGAIASARVSALALEDARRRADGLAEIDRAKDEFLATMSHELRTPLNAILGWAKLLHGGSRDGSTDPQQLAHGLAVIERNAQTQARIVGDLLDISRIISGKLRLTVQRVDVAAVVLAAVDVVRQAADARGVRLEVELPPDTGMMVGDGDRLQQIVWNLLSNAVKFTPRGGLVTVRAERRASTIVLTVTDTGVGIAPEDLPLVFERFKQGDSSTTRAHGGLGLGLSIVRQLAEAHGGTADAHSEGRGLGARLSVTLPIRAVFVDEEGEPFVTPPAEPSPAARPGASRALAGLRAIIVDDEVDSRDLLAMVLEHEGAVVTSKSDADEVLAEIADDRFDVLVSDIGMPGKDGHMLVREVRARGLRLPAVALTAYVRSEDAAKALAAGYQRHLPKPVDATELVKVIGALVGRRSAG